MANKEDKRILLASGNPDKRAQLAWLAEPYGFSICTPFEHAQAMGLKEIGEVEETEDSYLGNARLKAEAYHTWAQIPVVADDSGIEAEALNGRPGIFSARYGAENLSYPDRIQLLNTEIEDSASKSRALRYVCVLVFMSSERELQVRAQLTGELYSGPSGEVSRGEGGFGYDPAFYLSERDKTMAELNFEEICEISHRAQAARLLFPQI